jgi:hypothetical protein
MLCYIGTAVGDSSGSVKYYVRHSRSIGKVTGCLLYDRGSCPAMRKDFFPFHATSKPAPSPTVLFLTRIAHSCLVSLFATLYTLSYFVGNYWISGLCASSGILNTRKHNVSEAGSVSVLTYSVGSLRKR